MRPESLPDTLPRRSVLAKTGGCVLASATITGAANAADQLDSGGVSQESFPIREGTSEETTVYVTTADADGPTAFVIGGMHGNEVAGYTAAGKVSNWAIEAGTLVTIPEANAVAIERGTRNDQDGNNLNRVFPEWSTPETKLGRAIWNVVSKYQPDVVIDLHESIGIYGGNASNGVGQAIFTGDGTNEATQVTDFVNRNYVDDPDLAFQVGGFSSPDARPQDLLVHKAARDLGADAFLAETYSGVALEQRVQWHTAIVERLLRDEVSPNGIISESEPSIESQSQPQPTKTAGDESGSDSVKPTAKITTLPTWTSVSSLDKGQTITLDASQSNAPPSGIDCYEWKIGPDGTFEKAGAKVDVTVEGANYPVTVRVRGNNGTSDTDEVTLSTGC
ncbi:succinylglutamate desuccinylase/aspartoacylase domain-containing protein [Natrinema caseinilyticum]|uniref:succinylglutamate desuccinylase/aspartoacylase domain-containing protein n=1 Tax=Natrinema caseinilyticum TaxID=2961570 RepID=UPI002114F1D6|nr:succinylglutamate desuccinylase/aspartoacylase family protein [Natrinema caseinilyticum]